MFEEYAESIAGLEFAPLRVECDLADSVVSTQGLHFDAILSYSVVEEQTQGEMLPDKSDYIRVPLPLRQLWESPGRRVPLWASTDLVAKGQAPTASRYWHRRGLSTHMTKKNLRLTGGPDKEMRMPMPTINAQTLICDVEGNAEEIARLLSRITAIGKKRGTAGAVIRWRIYEVKTFCLLDENGCARRPIPGAYSLDAFSSMPLDLSLMSFSPPYWHPFTRSMCIPFGGVVRDVA